MLSPIVSRLVAGLGLVALTPAMAGAQHGIEATRDPISQAIVAAVIVAVFVLLALEKAHRVLVVFGAVAALWLVTYLTPFHLAPFEASSEHLDLNVILLLAAMMAMVGVLKSTGVFSWAVGRLLGATRGRPLLVMQALIWFTAIVSALVDNVTTVVFTAPMAVLLARETRMPPAAYLLPMVMAANIGGTATLIGDPPNILIGSGAGLSFVQFLENLALPVFCMMVGLDWYTRRYYRNDFARGRAEAGLGVLSETRIDDPLLLKFGIAIGAAVFVGFLTHPLTGMPAAVPAAIGAALLLLVQDVLYVRRRDPSLAERVHGILHVIEREIEWPTLSFFALLFITVGAGVETGLIDTLSSGLAAFIRWGEGAFGLSEAGTLLFAGLLILWTSGILSALIDNIPFVAVVIPIIASLTGQLSGDTEVLWWSLALGACLGGNGTVIGASANVTVIGLAERAGAPVGFREFARFGARVTAMTLVAASFVIAGYLYFGRPQTQAIAVGLVLAGALLARSRRPAPVPAG